MLSEGTGAMNEATIFATALEKRDPAERSAYLEEACGGDAGLRKRVEALLESHGKAGNFLERPAVEQWAAAPPLAGTVTGAEQDGGDPDALGFLRPSSQPGSLGRLAHYEVREVLGQGGCGIVLKAFDEKLHRLVALKVMAPHLATTSPPRKRFLREARSAAAVRHENVVTIYAVEEQPVTYLVMEYVAGETLQQRIDRTGPLEVPEVLGIGRQIADGLAAAHALGLIHRDIKPANVLLETGVEPRVKISDFGLARAADDASLTQSGVIAGTPLYMAPEQARGEELDHRADLFSLGSVLYVLCTGRPPFRASNTLAVLKRVTEDTPRPIREIIPEVPDWLCAIISRLHAKQPADRFASAREVANLLAHHLAKLQQDRGRAPLALAPDRSSEPSRAAWLAAPPAGEGEGRGATPGSAPVRRPPPPRRGRWAAAFAVFFLLLAGLGLSEATGVTRLWGTVIRLFASDGTLVVEVDDPEVSITLDGVEVDITGAGVKEIRVRPGQYEVRATKDGKLLSREVVTVSKNSRHTVFSKKFAGPAAAHAPARGPLDLRFVPADAGAAVVVRPRRIVQSPLIAAALPPAAAAEMVKELGVKPEQVEQVIVFLQAGAAGGRAAAPPGRTPVPGAVIRFTEPVDGKQVLTRLLKGLREEVHEGKTYYRSSTGEALLGLPLAGAVPDGRTVLVAPESVLRKMLAAGGGAKSPLLDRLRQTDTADEVTAVVLLEPYRELLKALAGPFKPQLPPDLAAVAGLPERLVALTATVNLRDKTLLKVVLEANSAASGTVLDDLAFKGLNWARKVYPGFRPILIGRLPVEVAQPALAIADQLFGGIQVTREGKRLVVRLEKPEALGTSPEKDLIAAAGFNDARGMNSDPVPGSPYPLDTPNREGGIGEFGWAGAWPAHPAATFQSKVVFEGDGALFLTGAANVGPNFGRQLVQPQHGRFQIEYHVQIPAGSTCVAYVWQDRRGGALRAGPQWTAGGGKFSVGHGDVNGDFSRWFDTGFKCEPGKWYKVTLRIDVPQRTWEFFVDGQRFAAPESLRFRAKVQYLDYINFLVAGGVYIDALRVTRLPASDR